MLPRISEIHFALNILIDPGSTQKLFHSIDQCSINMSKGRQWCLHSYLSFKIPEY